MTHQKKAIYNFNYAQTEMYCYDHDFSKEVYATAENYSEKQLDDNTFDEQSPIVPEDYSHSNIPKDEDDLAVVDSILDDVYKKHENHLENPSKPKQHDELDL